MRSRRDGGSIEECFMLFDVLDLILQKRGKDDLFLLFDGRSRPCRKVFGQYDKKPYNIIRVIFITNTIRPS